MLSLAILLERFAGTNQPAPLATGIHNYNVYHYDCHCGKDNCNNDSDCHYHNNNCRDCFDCHYSKDNFRDCYNCYDCHCSDCEPFPDCHCYSDCSGVSDSHNKDSLNSEQ